MSDFFDLQINGCFGVDFNSHRLTADEWTQACNWLHRDGTTRFLPTLITDSLDAMLAKTERLSHYIDSQSATSATAVGIHLEGPFLSDATGYVGAHPAKHTRNADLDSAKRLMEAGNGHIKLWTIAPERDPDCKLITFLVTQGVCVAAGHTDASRDQLMASIDAGLSLFTHLGNACPPLLPRHDNIIHRVLSLRDSIRVSLIADGAHLPYWLLRSMVDWFGVDRVSIVSDAISAAGLPAGMHTLGDQQVLVGDDGVPRSPDGSHFVGSGMSLGKMAERLETELQFSKHEIELMLSINPTRLIAAE